VGVFSEKETETWNFGAGWLGEEGLVEKEKAEDFSFVVGMGGGGGGGGGKI